MATRTKAPAPIVAPEMASFTTLGEGDTPTKAGAALTHVKADKRLGLLQKIPGATPSAWARFVVDRLCDIDPAVRRAALEWLRSHREQLTLPEESAALERLGALRAILTPDERYSFLRLLQTWSVALRDEDLAWLAPMLDDPERYDDARSALGALARTSDAALRVMLDTTAHAPAASLSAGLDAMPLDRLRALSTPLLNRPESRSSLGVLRALAPIGAELVAVKDALRALANADPSIAPDALIALATIDPQAVPELPERFDAWLSDGEYGRQSFACALAARRYPQWLLARADASPRTLLSLSDDAVCLLGPSVASALLAIARDDAYDTRTPRLLAKVLGEQAVSPLVELLKPLSTGRFEAHRKYADWRRVVECSQALRAFGERARAAAPMLLAIARHNHDAVLSVYLEVCRAIAATGEDPGIDAWLDEISQRAAARGTEGATHAARLEVALIDAQRGLEHLDARWPEVEAVAGDSFGLYRRWGYEALTPYVDQGRVRALLARAMESDPAPENQRYCAEVLGALRR